MAIASSIDRFVRRLTGRGARPDFSSLPVWMHPIELSQVRAIVESVAPERVLEWGAGGSTRELLEVSPFIQRYVSIEHNRRWHALVRDKVRDPRLELHLVEPSEPEPVALDDGPIAARRARRAEIHAWHLRAEREPELMRDYVALPETLGTQFDLVLVDGRARCFCIRAGFRLLRSGGVLIVHDAQRREYHSTLHEVGRPVFLEPWEQGQVCFVRKP